MLQVRIFTNQNKEEKPMSLTLQLHLVGKLNTLADQIVESLSPTFPASGLITAQALNVKPDELEYALDFMVNAGYIFESGIGYALTEKTAVLLISGSFSPMIKVNQGVKNA